ncbi:MAG: hypothetical protein KF835_08540 [Xanthobacteraceae bacterium]|nr:hypothetical protein [Xanthobacteraceae bacterium]
MTEESDREDGPVPNPRPKRKPPVIDAEAKDVTPPEPEAKDEHKPEPERASAPKPAAANWLDWRAVLPAFAVAAACGVGAGLLGAWIFSPGASQPANASATEQAIAQLSSRLAAQETKQIPTADLAPLNERSAKLETVTGELRGELAEVKKLVEAQANAPTAAELNAVNRRLAAIEEKIVALASPPKQEAKNEPQPADIVALGALRDAVATGGPFANELAAVRAILKDRAAPLAPLDQFAGSGLPTVAALAKRFEPLASKLASPPVPQDSGVFQRLLNNAGKLVEVRPVGEPKGSDAGAVVARMETKLSRGDLAGALEESKALPAQTRELAKDWFALAEQRRDAEFAIKNLINAALAAISAERPKQ